MSTAFPEAGTERARADATIRHRWPDRAFHWAMALVVLVLLFSAFLPIAGVEFDWIPWHWIAGVLLTVLIVAHVLRAVLVLGLGSMWPGTDDLREVRDDALGSRARASSAPPAPAKYDAYQKSYHWLVALVVLVLIASGIPMLIKLDTVLWQRNPGILSDVQWGYVYVAHGIASLALIFLFLLHVYFAVLPEHRALLRAMLSGRGPPHVRGDRHG